VTDGDQLGRFLAALPVGTQQRLGVPCLANHVVGAAHTCRWEPVEVHATPAPA
jgi:hypothetical protein